MVLGYVLGRLLVHGIRQSRAQRQQNGLTIHTVSHRVDRAPPVYGVAQMPPQGQAGFPLIPEAEQAWEWSWCPLITAVISFLLCPLLGYVATVLSLLSYADHRNSKYNDAQSKKTIALACGIIGIVVGLCAIFTCIITLTTSV